MTDDPPEPGAVISDDPGRERALLLQDVEVLRRRVVSAVRRHCPSWLAGQAEDIVQDVLLKLVKTSSRSEGERTFSPVYLEKSVHGALVDEIRRACRWKESPTGEPGAMEDAVSPRAGPQRSTASLEIATGVRHCLTTLAQSRRLAVTLYLQGCSVPEAAHLLRWPTKRTENLVYRGLHDLRRCLRGRGLTP